MHYGYIDPRLNRFILCCDNARFINHSNAPNVGPDLTDDTYGIDTALRDIEPGEEITVDYLLVEGAGVVVCLCFLCFFVVVFGASVGAGASAAVGAADFGMSAAMAPATRPKANRAVEIRVTDLFMKTPKKRWY